MTATDKNINLFRTILVLSLLFIFTQLLFRSIIFSVDGIVGLTRSAMTTKLFFSKLVFFPVIYFLFVQVLINAAYIYLLWYVVTAVGELFSLRATSRYFLCLFLWLNSVIVILSLNMYYVAHSRFTSLIRHDLFGDTLTNTQLQWIVYVSIAISLLSGFLALINLFVGLMRRQHTMRHSIMLFFVIGLMLFCKGPTWFAGQNKVDVATADTPNIFIIGFDALRPDFLTYFNQDTTATPHFDDFLKSSAVFTEAYTPIARTQPSWTGILTGKYPLSTNVRENNTNVAYADLSETLPSFLKKAGYETVYATDDRRFNNIDETYGFDRVLGPSGTVPDYLLGTINDFPLSNLLIPTNLGKWLFPYSYANHSATHTYDPDNFLASLKPILDRSNYKPLFLAIHFDLSGWPYYWFNDKLAYDADGLGAYRNAVAGDDALLAKFLDILKQNNLLNHAIVVVLSDHGVTLGLHHDRLISEETFHGDKTEMKVKRARYAGTDERISAKEIQVDANDLVKLNFHNNAASPFNLRDYGIDTSYGYGSDLLSLKQNHTLLAIRGYGVNLGVPHQVFGRSSLLDIAPTLLDVLHLPALQQSAGTSLKPYLYQPNLKLSNDRPIYLESSFTITDIEQQNIVAAKVAEKSLHYYEINYATGRLNLYPQLVQLLIDSKQRAILQGDWLFVYYPSSERFRFVNQPTAQNQNNWNIISYIMPPYFVLVNIKTGAWATEMSSVMIWNSPMTIIKQRLNQFYGREMDNYSKVVT